MNIYKNILCALFFTNNVYIFSASGTLNTAFGTKNTGMTAVAVGRYNRLNAIALQSDDTIIGVGSVSVFATVSGICRFTANGTLDTTYNEIGYTQLARGTTTILTSVAVQANNYAVVGGYAVEDQANFIVARYDTTGALDQSFNNLGYVTTPIGTGSNINAIAIQSDGKILAGGVAFQGLSMFALARYNTDGSLDKTFGKDGIVLTGIQYVSCINALALQPDGKILAAGFSWNGSANQYTVARYNEDGTPDLTFGNQGIVIASPGIWSEIQTIQLQTDGYIVLGGSITNDNVHHAFAIMRLDPNGNPDSSFNGNGTVITQMDYSAKINSLAIQSNGNIIAGGSNYGPRTTDFALARYLPSGAPDLTFGTNGITLTAIGASAQISGLAIQTSGNIIAAGTSDDNALVSQYIA